MLVALALIVLDKNKAYPSWRTLLPTLGTFLLISAGPQAWFNRTVLAHRALVYIGLISYPLYLWHWPLLSFARIMESGAPTGEIKIAAGVISVVLAGLTYKFIGQPLRKTRFALFLLVALSSVAATGFLVFSNGGIPTRSSEFYKERLFFSWPESYIYDDNCRKHYPEAYYCKISNAATAPTVALIGDSHANHFFVGLSDYFSARGENLILLGGGGCVPLLNVESHPGGVSDKTCKIISSGVFRKIIETQSVKTILFAANWSLYIHGRRKSEIYEPEWELKTHDRPELTNNLDVLTYAFNKTFEIARDKGKRLILLHQVPEASISPRACGDPARSCNENRHTVVRGMSKHKEFLSSVLSQYPDVTVIDPIDVFCDASACFVSKNGEIFYRDLIHLSARGSIYFSENLHKAKSWLHSFEQPATVR